MKSNALNRQNPMSMDNNDFKGQDFLSSIELFTLGNAIEIMSEIDIKWVKRQIKTIKKLSINEQKDAIFELLGMSYLVNDDYLLRPTPRNTPGIDAIVENINNQNIEFSLKNYGISAHSKDFDKKLEELEKYYRLHLIRRNISNSILFDKSYLRLINLTFIHRKPEDNNGY